MVPKARNAWTCVFLVVILTSCVADRVERSAAELTTFMDNKSST
jgi:hypothetical protein